MPARNGANVIDEQKPEGDDHRSLVRIAARLLYTKPYEQKGADELVLLAAQIESIVKWRYILCTFLLVIFSLLTFVGFLAWVMAAANGNDLGFSPLIIIGPLTAVMFGILFYRRYFQYGINFGRGPIPKARPAIYGNANKETVETLERLFAYLAMRTSPRIY